MELNTIASSFGCLSTLTSHLHRHILGRAAGAPLTSASGAPPTPSPNSFAAEALAGRLPDNDAMEKISDGMAAAIAAAGGGVMVMIVQPGERNAYDQQWLQQALWERHGVATVRMTLAQAAARCGVDAATGEMRIKEGSSGGGERVGLVYFRCVARAARGRAEEALFASLVTVQSQYTALYESAGPGPGSAFITPQPLPTLFHTSPIPQGGLHTR